MKDTNKTDLTIILLAAGLAVSIAIMLVGATTLLFNIPMSVNIENPVVTGTITIDGTTYNPGTTATITFGTLAAGESATKSAVIKNTGNQPLTISYVKTGLPSGWTLATPTGDGATLEPGAQATGTFILTVSASAVDGAFSFSCTVNLNS